jgi:hypothetical protein
MPTFFARIVMKALHGPLDGIVPHVPVHQQCHALLQLQRPAQECIRTFCPCCQLYCLSWLTLCSKAVHCPLNPRRILIRLVGLLQRIAHRSDPGFQFDTRRRNLRLGHRPRVLRLRAPRHRNHAARQQHTLAHLFAHCPLRHRSNLQLQPCQSTAISSPLYTAADRPEGLLQRNGSSVSGATQGPNDPT